jgi:hypothetical protein
VSELPYVYLTWPAQLDLEQLEYGTGDEVAGGLFGRASERRIVVERIVQNPSGPYEPERTPVDVKHFARLEQIPTATSSAESRLLGDVHSHEVVSGPARASDRDLDHWATLSRAPGQPAYAGLILTPARELWEGGFPSGRFDWDEPILSGWVARDGEVWSTTVVLEEEEDYLLDQSVRFREEHHGT